MITRTMRLYPAPIRTERGTVWGYIDKMGSFAITPIFQYAMDFQPNGLAVVKSNDQYGLINEFGTFVVKPSFTSFSDFAQGRAIVIKDDGFYVINEQGKLLTKKPYNYISMYQESRAVFTNNMKYGYLDLNGEEVIPAQYQSANDFQNGLAIVQTTEGVYKLIDKEGVVKQTYKYAFVGMQGEGLIAFKEKKDFDAKYGVMTMEGKVIIPPTYSSIQPFQEGLSVVNLSDNTTNKVGVINSSGQYIIKPLYNDANILGEERIAVGKAIKEEEPYRGSMFAISTTKGTFLTEFNYTHVLPYENEYASASNDKLTFFINKNGKIVQPLPIVSGNGTLTFTGDLVKAFVDNRISYYTLAGRQIWEQNKVIPINRKYKVIENKYRPNQQYLVYYPQIDGITNVTTKNIVNEKLKNLSMSHESPENLANSEYTADFNIQLFKKQLLVLELHSYLFPFGAAHGMPYKTYTHIDLQKGNFYELKDLFKENSDYVENMNAIITEKIKTDDQYSYVFPEGFKSISPNQPFYVSEDSLFIYFAPYEIAPFVAGFPTFEIPFFEIQSLINEAGEFWRAFH